LLCISIHHAFNSKVKSSDQSQKNTRLIRWFRYDTNWLTMMYTQVCIWYINQIAAGVSYNKHVYLRSRRSRFSQNDVIYNILFNANTYLNLKIIDTINLVFFTHCYSNPTQILSSISDRSLVKNTNYIVVTASVINYKI